MQQDTPVKQKEIRRYWIMYVLILWATLIYNSGSIFHDETDHCQFFLKAKTNYTNEPTTKIKFQDY